MKRLDKFLIRFFVGTLILLCLVIADKYQYIDLDEYKEKISNNINPLNLINKINGKLEIVDLGTEEEISVSSNYKEYHIIDENIRRYDCNEFEPVNNYIAGVVSKIERKQNKTYTITILGIDNRIYQYSNLESFDYHIYNYIKTDEIIGNANDYYELMILNQ